MAVAVRSCSSIARRPSARSVEGRHASRQLAAPGRGLALSPVPALAVLQRRRRLVPTEVALEGPHRVSHRRDGARDAAARQGMARRGVGAGSTTTTSTSRISPATRPRRRPTLVELAADAQYEHKHGPARRRGRRRAAVRLHAAPNPWPEGKLDAKWRPHYGSLELDATVARKGRVPSLRERFDPMTGNPSARARDDRRLRAARDRAGHRSRCGSRSRRSTSTTTGTVRSSPNPADDGRLVNLGVLEFYGFDLLGRVRSCSRRRGRRRVGLHPRDERRRSAPIRSIACRTTRSRAGCRSRPIPASLC